MVQFTHIGRKMPWDSDPWLAPVAPSRVREHLHTATTPREMEDWDFPRIVRDYGQAARRAKEGGLDGCELQCAYQNLIDSFWTPSINKRTDGYGGSLENRTRFARDILAEVRKHVGDDFIVGMRLAGDEYLEGGLTQADCMKIAQIFTDCGMVDYLNVIGGQMQDYQSFAYSMPSMNQGPAPQLHLASAVRAETGMVVFHARAISAPRRRPARSPTAMSTWSP